MRATFSKEALVNYHAMVEAYGDIYLNEYGQVSRNKENHEMKYLDEKRKVPSKSCMYVQLNKANFPTSVEKLDSMFLEQTLKRNSSNEAAKNGNKIAPDVIIPKEGAFDKFLEEETKEPEIAVVKQAVGKKKK